MWIKKNKKQKLYQSYKLYFGEKKEGWIKKDKKSILILT